MVAFNGSNACSISQDGLVADKACCPQVGKHLCICQDEAADVEGNEVGVRGEGGVGVEVPQGGQGQVDKVVEGIADVDLRAGYSCGAQGCSQELKMGCLLLGKLSGQVQGLSLNDGLLPANDRAATSCIPTHLSSSLLKGD